MEAVARVNVAVLPPRDGAVVASDVGPKVKWWVGRGASESYFVWTPPPTAYAIDAVAESASASTRAARNLCK